MRIFREVFPHRRCDQSRELFPEMAFSHLKIFNLFAFLAIVINSLDAVSLDEFQHTLKIVRKTCQTRTKITEGKLTELNHPIDHPSKIKFNFLVSTDLLQRVRSGDFVNDPTAKVSSSFYTIG